MRVAIRADGGAELGLGHLTRCGALAEALSRNDIQVQFITFHCSTAFSNQLESKGVSVKLLEECRASKNYHYELSINDEHTLNETDSYIFNWKTDAYNTMQVIGGKEVDWLIIDHYSIDKKWENQLRLLCNKIMIIDDIPNRSHSCDLLIDPTYGRSASDYSKLVPDRATVLAGSRYALLRDAFAQRRAHVLQERIKREGRLERVLILFGSMDPNNYSGKVLAELSETAPHLSIDIVLSSESPRLNMLMQQIEQYGDNVSLHLDIDQDMIIKLMSNADLSIGASGSTAWERCCLGLPSILWVMAENQSLIGQQLSKVGAAILMSSDSSELGDTLSLLLSRPDILLQMSRNAAEIVDGVGADRIVSKILEN